jgi:SAM-dependent methyltransferase
LAARRLGARVHSFDYDSRSVECTSELRRRYYGDDPDWHVEKGSILDDRYIRSLGTFDVVYAWGVLHHTGAMWEAMANVSDLVAPAGKLFLAIYNDQGRKSRRWTTVKRWYNAAPGWLQPAIAAGFLPRLWGPTVIRDLLQGHPTASWRAIRSRGMSAWTDVVDWVGGYPFEVAKPEQLFGFFSQRGYVLVWLRTCGGGLGNNQMVFERTPL